MTIKSEFYSFLYNVRNCTCKECALHDNISESIKPIQLSHVAPEKIRVVVISEQPKIIKNVTVTNCNFLNVVNGSSTVEGLNNILGKSFNDSISKRNGLFYWTHHTKCPNEERKPQKICAERHIKNELSLISDLRLIISFGSEIFKHLSGNLVSTIDNPSFIDFFYELLVENINGEPHTYCLEIEKKSVTYLALPHPSAANPLAPLNLKIRNLITKYISEAIA